jgi:hypothetical protein
MPIHRDTQLSYLDLSSESKDDRMELQNQTLNIMVTLEQTLRASHNWAVDRIHYMSKKDIDNAYAIKSEFSEWLNPDISEHDIFSLEYIGE